MVLAAASAHLHENPGEYMFIDKKICVYLPSWSAKDVYGILRSLRDKDYLTRVIIKGRPGKPNRISGYGDTLLRSFSQIIRRQYMDHINPSLL